MGAHPAASERDARSLQDAVPFEAAVACAISSGIERSRRAARLSRRRSADEEWVSAPYLYNIIEAALTLTRPQRTAQFTARAYPTLSKFLRTLRVN